MRQLQFKFDPLPAESAGICLFHQRWIKTFDTQPFLSIVHQIWPSILENDLVRFCNNYLVGSSKKKHHLGTRKMENEFFVQRK